MAWITLTETEIAGRLAAPELTAVTSAAVRLGQTAEQILAGALKSVTAEVRGYVAACSRNVLGPAGTIPDELEGAALALIRRHLFTRLPKMESLFDDLRQKEAEDALVRLRDTAACRFAIVPPVLPAPAEEQAGDTVPPDIEERPLHFSRRDQDGL